MNELAAELILTGLRKTSAVQIPGLVHGTPEKSCGNCYHFGVYRENLPLIDRNQDIIGPCKKWGAYSRAQMFCQEYNEGGPDVQ